LVSAAITQLARRGVVILYDGLGDTMVQLDGWPIDGRRLSYRATFAD